MFSWKVIQLLFKLKCANFWQGQTLFTGMVVLLHTWSIYTSTISQTLLTIQEWIFFNLIPVETNESCENNRENVQHNNDEWTKNMWRIWNFKWFRYTDRVPQTEIWESLLIHYSFLTISLNTLRLLCQYIITELKPEAAIFFFIYYCYYCFYRIYSRRSEGLFKPARVHCLSFFKDTSTELRGGAALLEFLQTLLRILSKQETLQRVEESALHELLFLLRAGFFLETEDLRHLLLQVAEQLCPGVCSLQPFLQHQTQEHDWFHNDLHLSPPSES